MITTFEVGSVFKIVDQATPVLRNLSREVGQFNVLVKEARDSLAGLGRIRLTGIDQRMKALATSAGALRKEFGSTFTAMNTGTAVAIADARALAAEWRAVATSAAVASRALRLPGPRTPGTPAAAGARGGGGGFHVSSLGVPLPGGVHARFRGGGNAAMAGLGALAYGVYEEAEIEDIAARAIMTSQVKVDAGMTGTAAYQKLRSIIQKNATLGGFDPKEVGEAILGSERQFAGLPFDKRMDVLNVMLPAAMQESRFKETSLKESAESLVGLAHMTGTYDPAKLPELYRKFNFASMITPATLPEFSRALSYSMPSLVAGMGMDPEAIMFITAMNQAAGIKSTKAGTWVQAFFGKLMPDVGANITRSQEKHNAALFQMGLIDSPSEHAKPTWLVRGAGGKTDWMSSLLKLTPILGDKLQALPDTQRLQMLDQVFGKQGGREAGLMNLKEFVAQFPVLAQMMKTAPGGEGFLNQLGEASPVQKAREAFSDLKNVLMDIGSVALPPLTDALKSFDGVLKALKPYLPSPGSPGANTGADALRGAPLGAVVGMFTGIGAGPGAFLGAVAGGAAHALNAGIDWLTGAPAAGQASIWGNVIPPANALTIEPAKVTVNLDKRAVGEAVIEFTAKQGAGPAEGAPYHDGTYSTSPLDLVQ